MVIHLMSSKETACTVNELVGEAAFDVLFTELHVTTASIIRALQKRMLTEQDHERCVAYLAAINALTPFATPAGAQCPHRNNDKIRSGTKQYPALRSGKYRH